MYMLYSGRFAAYWPHRYAKGISTWSCHGSDTRRRDCHYLAIAHLAALPGAANTGSSGIRYKQLYDRICTVHVAICRDSSLRGLRLAGVDAFVASALLEASFLGFLRSPLTGAEVLFSSLLPALV